MRREHFWAKCFAPVGLALGAALLSVLFGGCPTTKETAKAPPGPAPAPPAKHVEPVPDMIITVASLDLGKHAHRIEQQDIDEFTEILRRERVDVLSLQAMSRYPGVSTRLDPFDALTTSTGMRSLFGEMINQSGRQTGNAIFSTYPINSHENTRYTGLQSMGFETALQAIIDCGVREVVAISTELPDSASYEDLQICMTTLNSFTVYYLNDPLIISGNLPRSDQLRSVTHFATAKPFKEESAPRVWYTGGGPLKVMGQRVAKSPLGLLTLVEFGIFRPSKP